MGKGVYPWQEPVAAVFAVLLSVFTCSGEPLVEKQKIC